ncbi:MAG TPA: 7-carboxy-7-deazaguanine synthase QueE [Thermoanaerobaculia bacterium]|mgnify:FL=1|nr:7-carboxy-7-deazaguanine synthase QueE [Thermoanaerobaculia bacterium]HUM28741.1 7-carboxy-7-deazaguanine synthase QueE [Thermoanaerobaculia bacterium]HXK68009.1 7-carboxy-7-deazaguanine synthase QueE [Thermoanaerobaculia bacterium]
MKTPSEPKLIVSEIFSSIQGEGPFSGHPMVFVRLSGCRRHCRYCDTPYALDFTGDEMSLDEIMEKVKTHPWRHVEITGGEPMHQEGTAKLLQRLVDADYTALLETSGLESLSLVPEQVHVIMDIKTPGAAIHGSFLEENLKHLGPEDAIKFVICDRKDFDWAIHTIVEHDLLNRCPVYLSPSFHDLRAEILAGWILEQELPLRLNLQIHKVLWGEARAR